MTLLETAIRKRFCDNVDVAYWLERVRSYHESAWIAATNQDSEDFTIFNTLADVDIVAVRSMPIWVNGNFRGNKISFLYSESLTYNI